MQRGLARITSNTPLERDRYAMASYGLSVSTSLERDAVDERPLPDW